MMQRSGPGRRGQGTGQGPHNAVMALAGSGRPHHRIHRFSPIHRSLWRGLLSPRVTLSALSARDAVVRAGDEDPLYYAGLRRCRRRPLPPGIQPAGPINLGLAEIHLPLDLVGRWMDEHAGVAMLERMTGGGEERDFTIRGPRHYQWYDGILALRMVKHSSDKW